MFLDITGDEDRSFIGDFRYIQIMMSKLDLTQEEIDERGTGEADYARAFCNHREVFPDCAGLFRARYGLVVAEPDEVMDYIRLTRPARKGSWWPGGPRTRTDGLR